MKSDLSLKPDTNQRGSSDSYIFEHAQGRVKLNQYDNSWYQPGSKVKRLIWFFVNIIIFKNPFLSHYGIKAWVLRMFGAKVGKNVLIKPSVNIKYPWFIELGNDIWIGENVWLDNHTRIKIGNDVCLSQGAVLMTGNHNYKSTGFDLVLGEIEIEDGVWIGAHSIVCPGVICRSHAVLAVGSTATKDMEAYQIYQGNPAKPIRQRNITN